MRCSARTLAALFPVALLVAASLVPSSLIFGAERPQAIRPVPTPALSARSSFADIQAVFDAMEKSVELEYAKLVQDARSQKAALEEKIKELESQIESLRATAKKLEGNATKLAEIEKGIETRKATIKSLKDQIKKLDQLIRELEEALAKEIAAVKEQKKKALELAAKARPAPTPTPGKR